MSGLNCSEANHFYLCISSSDKRHFVPGLVRCMVFCQRILSKKLEHQGYSTQGCLYFTEVLPRLLILYSLLASTCLISCFLPAFTTGHSSQHLAQGPVACVATVWLHIAAERTQKVQHEEFPGLISPQDRPQRPH